jgi:hypothetical protein
MTTTHRAHGIAPRAQGDELASPGTITLTSPFPICAEPATGHVPCAPGWGLREDGTGYFDPDGAYAGEAAALCWDVTTGRLQLSNNTSVVVGLGAA